MLAAAGSSQHKPAPAAGRWPIQTLTVEGNRHYGTAAILAVAGLKAGQMAGKEEFEAARGRLEATGMFETVGYRFAPDAAKKGYAAVFQVVEVEPVYPVRFEELGVRDAEILSAVKARDPLFGAELPGTAQVLARCAKEVEAVLAARNSAEKVAGKVVATGPEQFAVLFRPARSSPVVAEVSFTGNQVIPSTALQDAISGVAIGTAYNEERFRQLLDTSVRPLYDARGRIRVAFPKITAEAVKDVQGLHVTVAVSEGAAFDLGKVSIANPGPFQPDELLKTVNLKTGDMANFDDVGKGAERVRELLRHNGYLHGEAGVERKIDDAKHTVDVVIRLEQGPQFTFNKLDIKGLDLNGEAAVRKMWAIKPGKPFRAGYPDFFLNRVRETGMFDNLKKTRSAVNINEQDRTVDVTLYFNE
jgi:outer membrane protein assembly factor BamA